MLTQYDREMQQSSTFFFRSQDDKKNWGGVEEERIKGKNISSIPNLPIYVQFYTGSHNAKVF